MLKRDQSFSASHLMLSKLFYHIPKTKQNLFELVSTNKYTVMISYLVHCSSFLLVDSFHVGRTNWVPIVVFFQFAYITGIFTFDSVWNISQIARIIDTMIADRVVSLRYQNRNFAVVCWSYEILFVSFNFQFSINIWQVLININVSTVYLVFSFL